MKEISKIIGMLSLTTAMLLSTGCGSSTDTSATDSGSATTITGTFVDSVVAGLSYSCSSGTTGLTNIEGEFTCNEGDSVTFSVNGYEIGSAPAQSVITPRMLTQDETVIINIAQFLQTLDSDGDLTNGIEINTALTADLNVTDFTIDDTAFDTLMSVILDNTPLVDENSAAAHLEESIAVLKDIYGNNIPVAEDQSLNINKNSDLEITLTAIDLDGDALVFTAYSAQNGTLINTANGDTYVYPGSSSGTLSGTAPHFIYRPNVGYVGYDRFFFKVNDGTDDSETKTIAIMVNDVTKPIVLTQTAQLASYDVDGTNITDSSVKDDGFYKKGAVRSYSRDVSTPVVTDNVTGLMWQDDVALFKPWLTTENFVYPYNDTTGDTAATQCETLTLGDYADWRLPTVEELSTLMTDGSLPIDLTFENLMYSRIEVNQHYWTSTTYSSEIGLASPSLAFTVDFWGGVSIGIDKQYEGYVRCVRGEPLPPSAFSRSESNNTVIDNATGLEWQDNYSVAPDSNLSWPEAIDYCETLSLDSYSDWRLPNRVELQSIADYAEVNPAINPIFQNVVSGSYYSATTNYYAPTSAWVVNFWDGAVRKQFKENIEGFNFNVRCVR